MELALSKTLEKHLDVIASKTGKSKDFLIKQAIRWSMEDLEGVYTALARLEDRTDRIYTLNEVEKEVDRAYEQYLDG